jgi:hypothetical protein
MMGGQVTRCVWVASVSHVSSWVDQRQAFARLNHWGLRAEVLMVQAIIPGNTVELTIHASNCTSRNARRVDHGTRPPGGCSV